jgi:hypothetical protein
MHHINTLFMQEQTYCCVFKSSVFDYCFSFFFYLSTRHTSSVQRVHISKPIAPLSLRSSNPSLIHRPSWTQTGKHCVINHKTEAYKFIIVLFLFGKATGTVGGLSSRTYNTPYPVHDFSCHYSLFFSNCRLSCCLIRETRVAVVMVSRGVWISPATGHALAFGC